MEIKYEINRLDIWKFNRFHLLKRPPLRGILIIFFIFILYLTVRAFQREGSAAIILLMIYIIILTAGYNFLKWVIMQSSSTKAGSLGEHILQIDQNGIREQTKVNDNFYRWPGIIKIIQNKEYIFIYIDNIVAHLIPKRAFEDEQKAEQFYQYAIAIWNSTKTNT